MSDRWPLKAAMTYEHAPVGQAGRCILCGRLTSVHGTWWERIVYRMRTRGRQR